MKLLSWILSLFSKKSEKQSQSTEVSIKPLEEEEKPVPKLITENDFIELSSQFNIEVEALKAIFKVEAGGKSGFL